MAYSYYKKEASPRGQGIELTAIDSIAADLAKTGYAASRAKREELTREHEQSLISQLVQLEQELLRIKELSSLSTTAKSRCHLAWGRSLKNVFPWSQRGLSLMSIRHWRKSELTKLVPCPSEPRWASRGFLSFPSLSTRTSRKASEATCSEWRNAFVRP